MIRYPEFLANQYVSSENIDNNSLFIQVDLVEKREEIEEGIAVVLSEEFPGVVIDNQKRFTKEGIRHCRQTGNIYRECYT